MIECIALVVVGLVIGLVAGMFLLGGRKGVLIRDKELIGLFDNSISERDFWMRVEDAVVRWINRNA